MHGTNFGEHTFSIINELFTTQEYLRLSDSVYILHTDVLGQSPNFATRKQVYNDQT